MERIKVGSLFAGIGGIDLGFEQADFRIAWANEIDKDTAWVINNVTALAAEAIRAGENISADTEEKLQYEMDRITKKKEDVLDAFFSKTVTKEEMHQMREKYDGQLADLQSRLQTVRQKAALHYDLDTLRADVKREVTAIVHGDTQSEVFYKNVLDHLTVCHDNRVELRLNLLPQKWVFVLDKLQDIKRKERVGEGDGVCYCGNSLPISVNTPATVR